MSADRETRRTAGVFAALADPTRLALVGRLAAGPLHVGGLADAVGVPMVNISHHLGVLKAAGLVDGDKQGRVIVYALRPDVFTPGDGTGRPPAVAVGAYRLEFPAA